jgi:ATP-dependent Clp protease ATP-binding subunit ClpA
VFERFTERARRVVVLAQSEARMLGHSYIGTEHLLLGLIHEGEGVAAKALERLHISLDAVRSQIEEIIGSGTESATGHIPFTPRAKKVLELSLREALKMGHNYIGTEHLLLGLIREGGGVAAQVLSKLGADLETVREQVVGLLGYPATIAAWEAVAASEPEPSAGPAPARRPGPAWRVERVGPDIRFRRAEDEAERPPTCSRCESDLTESARYRLRDVPFRSGDPELDAPTNEPAAAGDDDVEGAPRRTAAFLYCGECGFVLWTNLMEPGD